MRDALALGSGPGNEDDIRGALAPLAMPILADDLSLVALAPQTWRSGLVPPCLVFWPPVLGCRLG